MWRVKDTKIWVGENGGSHLLDEQEDKVATRGLERMQRVGGSCGE